GRARGAATVEGRRPCVVVRSSSRPSPSSLTVRSSSNSAVTSGPGAGLVEGPLLLTAREGLSSHVESGAGAMLVEGLLLLTAREGLSSHVESGSGARLVEGPFALTARQGLRSQVESGPERVKSSSRSWHVEQESRWVAIQPSSSRSCCSSKSATSC